MKDNCEGVSLFLFKDSFSSRFVFMSLLINAGT